MKSHSKVLFWLLMTATAAVDAVAISWLVQAGSMSRASYLYDALVTGQLAVVTIWAVLGAGPIAARWTSAVALTLSAGFLTARLQKDLYTLAEAIGVYISFVSLLALVLWVLKQTDYWQRLTGAPAERRWQFSVAHMLALTTVVALVIVTLRRSFLFVDSDLWKYALLLTIGDVALATGIVLAWRWSQWLSISIARFGYVMFVWLAIGIAETLATLSGALGESIAAVMRSAKFDLMANTFIASLVIFLYLELAPIVSLNRPAEAAPPDGASER